MTIHRYTFADPYIIAELEGRYAAADPKERIRLLTDLYEDEDYQPPYQIAVLAVSDPAVEVRRWIARNGRYLDYKDNNSAEQARTSETRDLQKRLKIDPDPLVRAHLRENPDIMPVVFRAGYSKRWFHESSHLERLALVRNERIEEEFIEQLFSSEDTDLAITLSERFALCCAFLTNQKLIEKNVGYAGGTLIGFADVYARRFLRTLWLNAAKWPKDTGNLQYAVYSHVPADDETKGEVYESCDEPVWRKAILYKSDARRDPKTFAAGLLDRDGGCREVAYQRLADINDQQLKALLKGHDKAALRGLADNRVLQEPLRSDVQRQVRKRLQELGVSTAAFEDFDLMHLSPRREAKRGAGDQRRLARKLRVVQKNLDEVKARVDRLSSLFSIPSLIIFACAVGLVAALFVRWLR